MKGVKIGVGFEGRFAGDFLTKLGIWFFLQVQYLVVKMGVQLLSAHISTQVLKDERG